MNNSSQSHGPQSGAGEETRLSDLRPGHCATITGVGAESPDPAQARLTRRLQDLGLIPGRTISASRRAPLGDPTVFTVADYELCLRRSDAEQVRITAARKEVDS